MKQAKLEMLEFTNMWVQGRNVWYELKGLITRNVHVKYESPTSVIVQKLWHMLFRYEGQGHKVKNSDSS